MKNNKIIKAILVFLLHAPLALSLAAEEVQKFTFDEKEEASTNIQRILDAGVLSRDQVLIAENLRDSDTLNVLSSTLRTGEHRLVQEEDITIEEFTVVCWLTFNDRNLPPSSTVAFYSEEKPVFAITHEHFSKSSAKSIKYFGLDPQDFSVPTMNVEILYKKVMAELTWIRELKKDFKEDVVTTIHLENLYGSAGGTTRCMGDDKVTMDYHFYSYAPNQRTRHHLAFKN